MTEDETLVARYDENIRRYLESGREIGKFIMMDAALAMSSAKRGWENEKRPEVGRYEQRRIHIYAEINSAVNAIGRKIREWEYTHWMGFHPDDVQKLLKLREEWDNFDWRRETYEAKARAEDLRALFDPPYHKEDRLASWAPYFERRVKEPLQKVFAYNSFTGKTDKAKFLAGGSAGRYLVTVQDHYGKDDERNSFGGAWISMIFDETAEWPRGGLQSLCATREEGLGLVQEAIDNMPEMAEDREVFIG